MKITIQKFRIGELAERLNVERSVIRFWEKEFNIKAHRSPGGQRFYQANDVEKFAEIKELLYERGLTIAGARKYLRKNPEYRKLFEASKVTDINETDQNETHATIASKKIPDVTPQIIELQKKLIRLRELL